VEAEEYAAARASHAPLDDCAVAVGKIANLDLRRRSKARRIDREVGARFSGLAGRARMARCPCFVGDREGRSDRCCLLTRCRLASREREAARKERHENSPHRPVLLTRIAGPRLRSREANDGPHEIARGTKWSLGRTEQDSSAVYSPCAPSCVPS